MRAIGVLVRSYVSLMATCTAGIKIDCIKCIGGCLQGVEETARNLLDPLKASADALDTVYFDPSGTSGHERHVTSDKNTDSTHSLSGETDSTELSNSVSLLSLESSGSDSGNDVLEDYEKQDIQTKEMQLRELFPTEKP